MSSKTAISVHSSTGLAHADFEAADVKEILDRKNSSMLARGVNLDGNWVVGRKAREHSWVYWEKICRLWGIEK